MAITTSVEALDGSCIYCYTSCILGRALRIKEPLLDFCENMDPDKWDTTVATPEPGPTQLADSNRNPGTPG